MERRYHHLVNMYLFPLLSACGCDSDGTNATDCNPFSGQCVCKPHVAGVRCEHCEVRACTLLNYINLVTASYVKYNRKIQVKIINCIPVHVSSHAW